MKITPIAEREIEFTGKDGKTITGFMVSCFTEEGTAIEFWTTQDYSGDIVSATKFDPKRAVDVKIEVRVDNGKVKYRES